MPLPPHREDSGYQSSTSTSCTADVARPVARNPAEVVNVIEEPEPEDERPEPEDEGVEYYSLLAVIWTATLIAWLMGMADTLTALTIAQVFGCLVLVLKIDDMRYEELDRDFFHQERLKEFYIWCENLANSLWQPVRIAWARFVETIKDINDKFERGLQELFGDLFIAG
ncbi:Protein of unknown function [Pyronema omphalodes CBS 100304]|uniref:Uncharacterized protein n=1 Tax=Pyronema omphalodes (strain CBS 100304) TaxID=1076935 RepID=U4L246_PYROM|nr:Protein of unknown function [Pyronema omphalodes CBS 100304]